MRRLRGGYCRPELLSERPAESTSNTLVGFHVKGERDFRTYDVISGADILERYFISSFAAWRVNQSGPEAYQALCVMTANAGIENTVGLLRIDEAMGERLGGTIAVGDWLGLEKLIVVFTGVQRVDGHSEIRQPVVIKENFLVGAPAVDAWNDDVREVSDLVVSHFDQRGFKFFGGIPCASGGVVEPGTCESWAGESVINNTRMRNAEEQLAGTDADEASTFRLCSVVGGTA